MKERPILFSGPMVRAILDGRKTQTRRAMKPQPRFNPHQGDGCWYPEKTKRELSYANEGHFRRGVARDFSPYGKPGDRLWVRETWLPHYRHWTTESGDTRENLDIQYDADGTFRNIRDYEVPTNWSVPDRPGRQPSIFMPRWASRLTLEITGVRVERLQEISGKDCVAEGSPSGQWAPPIMYFKELWNGINAARGFGWDANPWVWVIEFRRAA